MNIHLLLIVCYKYHLVFEGFQMKMIKLIIMMDLVSRLNVYPYSNPKLSLLLNPLFVVDLLSFDKAVNFL